MEQVKYNLKSSLLLRTMAKAGIGDKEGKDEEHSIDRSQEHQVKNEDVFRKQVKYNNHHHLKSVITTKIFDLPQQGRGKRA